MKLVALLLATLTTLSANPKELRFAMAGDPQTFDPLQVTEIDSETVRFLTAGVLLRVNRATDRLEPELAESWQLTEGGRALTFRLRAGLRFSDGAALTSADVARTLTRAFDPKEASPVADALRAGKASPEIAVVSPREITIRYQIVKAGLERIFDGIAIVPRNPGKLPPSAGPFTVSEYRPGEYVRLVRNPNYWKRDSNGHQLPYLDSIRIDIQQNHDIELSRFLRGDLQLISSLEPDNFDRVAREKPGSARNLGASLDSEFLWFNQEPSKTIPEWKRKWFTSTAFRRAVSGAIHREDIVRVVYRGHAHAAAGPVSTANHFWFNAALKPRTADPQAALKLLAADGFALREGVLRDRDGHPVEFSLVTNAGNRPREKMAPLIQSDLRAIGIRISIVPLEMNSLMERMTKTFDYEAVLLGFGNVDPDPNEEMNVWLSSGAQHAWWPAQKTPVTAWEARIDELELKQAGEAKLENRKKAIDEVQRIVADQEPIVYLVNPDALCAIAPSVRGVQPGPLPPRVLWNIEWLRLE